MKRRIVLLLACVMLVAAVVSGCGGDGSTGNTGSDQTLTLTETAEPADLNPLTAQDVWSNELIGATMEGLVRTKENGVIEQGSGLAESWTVSDDGLVYTFKLRDAKWSDGSAITANDFVYAWTKAVDPETASPYAYLHYPIVGAEEFNTGEGSAEDLGIKAVDEKTFEVTLKTPTEYFTDMLILSVFYPLKEGILEEMGDTYASEPDKMIYSGPFKITSWAHDQEVVVEKNPDYWDAEAVKLDKIVFKITKETNTIVNMYENGDIDMMEVMPEFLDNYKDDAGFQSITELVTEYLHFNLQNEFFANVNIRKAFGMAINREEYVNDLLKNGCTPAYGFIPPAMNGVGGKSFRENNGDLFTDAGKDGGEEAKALFEQGLQELGKTREDMTGLSLVIGEGDINLKTAQVFQEAWKNVLGVDVEVKSLKFALRMTEYEADFTLGKEGWGADFNDPQSFLDLFTSNSEYNYGKWSNEEYDALLKKASSTTGDERKQALQDAEKILIQQDAVMYPTFFQSRNFVHKDYVKGHVRNGFGLYSEYKWTYIEK